MILRSTDAQCATGIGGGLRLGDLPTNNGNQYRDLLRACDYSDGRHIVRFRSDPCHRRDRPGQCDRNRNIDEADRSNRSKAAAAGRNFGNGNHASDDGTRVSWVESSCRVNRIGLACRNQHDGLCRLFRDQPGAYLLVIDLRNLSSENSEFGRGRGGDFQLGSEPDRDADVPDFGREIGAEPHVLGLWNLRGRRMVFLLLLRSGD